MSFIYDGISNEQLKAEEQRLLTQSMEMTDQGIALHEAATRHASDGPEPNQERFQELHADYMQGHEQHMRVHKEFMDIHKELQRRGH